MLAQWWQKNRQRLIVHTCQVCHQPIEPREANNEMPWHVCKACYAQITETSRCRRCGLPSVKSVEQCGECLQTPPLWRALYCVGDYQPPLSSCIHGLKHGRQIQQARWLVDWLMPQVDADCQLITWVPLHWRRQLWRGFNQSEWLARYVAQSLNVPCKGVFRRTRSTLAQQGLNRRQRQMNMRDAFELKTPPEVERVAIVDDVVTTGSTVHHLCKLLLDAGVKSVDIYCICRTPDLIHTASK
ncbi:ComF family protein [Vibrio intestinalis]|uniref:ComF family protein n=1 Tax=Vibrio intestinalis TaxID=2933291 RepID=UPI0021A607CA|nr:ComF family protein [Vibrio intestinalis]